MRHTVIVLFLWCSSLAATENPGVGSEATRPIPGNAVTENEHRDDGPPPATPAKGLKLTVTPHVMVKSFRWEEVNDNDETLLLETGPMYTFGADIRLLLPPGTFYMTLAGGFSAGSVDYFGYLVTPQGQRKQYTSRTIYGRVEASFTFGYKVALTGTLFLTLMAGLEYELWKRDLGAGAPIGYDERYTVLLARTGFHFSFQPFDNVSFFAATFTRMPFFLVETIDLASRGQGGPANLQLEPGINPLYVVEVGATITRFTFTLSYDKWTLSKSASASGFYQPRSKRETVGIRLGFTMGAL